MFQNVLAIALFVIPGMAAELHYLWLARKAFVDDKFTSTVRALCFSSIILLLRCAISIAGGHGELMVQELFFTIGNVGKYIILSTVMVILMPNAYLLVDYIQSKKRLTHIEKP